MKLAEIKTPQFGEIDNQAIFVPFLNEDGGTERVIEFVVTKNGPVFHGKEVFRLFTELGEMNRVESRNAFNMAYAFWKISIWLAETESKSTFPNEEAR
ncbi:MAG: hypothetical protein ISS83_02745 [Candidatus Pacebacteria bacterium]|nr:hypothetical protein [Candidatus Paceibacterota bacterium]